MSFPNEYWLLYVLTIQDILKYIAVEKKQEKLKKDTENVVNYIYYFL